MTHARNASIESQAPALKIFHGAIIQVTVHQRIVAAIAFPINVTKLPHRDQNCSLQNDAFGPAQFGPNSEGEGVIQVAEGGVR
jgi:hypothetical protein